MYPLWMQAESSDTQKSDYSVYFIKCLTDIRSTNPYPSITLALNDLQLIILNNIQLVAVGSLPTTQITSHYIAMACITVIRFWVTYCN